MPSRRSDRGNALSAALRGTDPQVASTMAEMTSPYGEAKSIQRILNGTNDNWDYLGAMPVIGAAGKFAKGRKLAEALRRNKRGQNMAGEPMHIVPETSEAMDKAMEGMRGDYTAAELGYKAPPATPQPTLPPEMDNMKNLVDNMPEPTLVKAKPVLLSVDELETLAPLMRDPAAMLQYLNSVTPEQAKRYIGHIAKTDMALAAELSLLL